MLTWVLLESPAALGAVLGLVLFVLLVLWRRGGPVRPLLIGVCVSVVLLVIQFAVVTHRERAIAALDAIAADLEKGRSGALAAALAADFAAGELRGDALTRARFVEYVEELLKRIDVVWTQRVDLEMLNSTADGFVVEAGYVAEIATGEARGAFRSRWALTFAKFADGWRIAVIEPVTIEGMPAPTWERIARE
jgi:hypothetical protein